MTATLPEPMKVVGLTMDELAARDEAEKQHMRDMEIATLEDAIRRATNGDRKGARTDNLYRQLNWLRTDKRRA